MELDLQAQVAEIKEDRFRGASLIMEYASKEQTLEAKAGKV
jgi:hypothetical protein